MSIAIVTSLFNCESGNLRHRHYQTFLNTIKDVPIYTIECQFDEHPFVLTESENVFQVRSNAWVWQRDRIINSFLDKIPKSFNNIALVDADIFFHDKKWWKDAEGMLKECVVGQLWENCHHNRDGIPPDRGISNRDSGIVHTGYAWAARRDFLEEFGLFDKSVVGGNDVFMTAAYCGWSRHPFFNYHTPEFMDCYFEWANKVIKTTKGDVGYIQSDIAHMWHGSKQDRNYIGRIELMKDYDPREDVKVSKDGCWEWSTEKPQLHKAIEDYMKSRTKG